MQYPYTNTINTREDLDAIANTEEYLFFIAKLKGSMTRKQDIQVYPENYNMPEYVGPRLEPIWNDVEDFSTIERFGFTKKDFE